MKGKMNEYEQLRAAMVRIRELAYDHPLFNQEAAETADYNVLADIGGDEAFVTQIVMIADEALKEP